MRGRYHAVTFDLWNTIFREVANAVALERARRVVAALADCGLHVSESTALDAVRAAWSVHRCMWRAGELCTISQAAEAALEALEVPASAGTVMPVANALQWMLPAEELDLTPNAISVIGKLRANGLKIGLVSDTGFSPGGVLASRLCELDLTQYFSGLSFSDEVGCCKPDSRMFRHALSYLGARPEEVVHVGDLARNDIEGAREAGFSTIRFTYWNDDRPSGYDADFVTDDLAAAAEWILGTG